MDHFIFRFLDRNFQDPDGFTDYAAKVFELPSVRAELANLRAEFRREPPRIGRLLRFSPPPERK